MNLGVCKSRNAVSASVAQEPLVHTCGNDEKLMSQADFGACHAVICSKKYPCQYFLHAAEKHHGPCNFLMVTPFLWLTSSPASPKTKFATIQALSSTSIRPECEDLCSKEVPTLA